MVCVLGYKGRDPERAAGDRFPCVALLPMKAVQESTLPASSLLGIYRQKIIIEKDTCTPKFTAALFTIGRT